MIRKTVNRIIAVTGLAFIIYYFALTMTMGPIAFSRYLLLGGIILAIFPFVDKLLEKNNIYVFIRKFAQWVVLVLFSIFIVTEIFIFAGSLQKNYDKADYTIVLGAGLRGENMSVTLKQRVDRALDYAGKNKDFGCIVMSGGQGVGEAIPEAVAMKRYVLQNGISEDHVLAETKSTSTYENLMFSIKLIEEHSQQSIQNLSIKIITSDFHILRAELLAKRLGIENLTMLAAPIRPIFIPTYYIREFLALHKTLFISPQ